jgi:hypothetical protein
MVLNGRPGCSMIQWVHEFIITLRVIDLVTGCFAYNLTPNPLGHSERPHTRHHLFPAGFW